MKAVLFDLDDTLYPEIEFVKSGFRYLSQYLAERYDVDSREMFRQMVQIASENGRGRVFDILLERIGHHGEEQLKLMVYLYRSHPPTIRLYDDVIPTMKQLRDLGLRLAIVTDGMAAVQKNKVDTLGLRGLFDIIVYSDQLGREYWKPSGIPYKVALEFLQTAPEEAAYVGDDPAKDFEAPNSMGMLTVQVTRQNQRMYVREATDKVTAADCVVNEVKQILPIIRGRDS